jgi:hypothetical protein
MAACRSGVNRSGNRTPVTMRAGISGRSGRLRTPRQIVIPASSSPTKASA